jgi:hypothetical protein
MKLMMREAFSVIPSCTWQGSTGKPSGMKQQQWMPAKNTQA